MDKITVSEYAQKTADMLSKASDGTAHVAEATVKALDPLHLFDPNPKPSRLILKENLFDTTIDYPILHARSNDAFHDLIVKSQTTQKQDLLVLEDASDKKPIVLMDRTPKPRIYEIYKTSPMTQGQAVAKTLDDSTNLYLRAKVVMSGDAQHLDCFLQGEADPTYTIAKAPGMMNFSTSKVVMMKDHSKPVASTSNWEEGTFMLEIQPGIDAALMVCLAIAADDVVEWEMNTSSVSYVISYTLHQMFTLF